MNLKKSVFIALVLTTTVASASEAVWPKNSASELSVFLTLLRFRIHTDHCSAKVPQLKPKFESLMEGLDVRIQGISKSLLASDAFKGMKGTQVPAEIIDAFTDSFDDVKHNFERQDAVSACPKALQKLDEMNDASLKSDLSDTLTAVQNMIRNLEKAGAP